MADNKPTAAPALVPLIFDGPRAPLGLYFSGEDLLRLSIYNSAAGLTVALRARFLPIGGTTARDVERTLTPATDRSLSSVTCELDEGWLLDAEVIVTAGTPILGQTYALLTMLRGRSASGFELGMLSAGCVSVGRRLAYPRDWITASVEGPGAIRSVAGTDPAANVEISEVVPTGARWRLRAIDAALVTDANVANREVTLTIDDGANVLAEVTTGVAQAASVTRRYSFAQGVQRVTAAASTIIGAPAPDLILLAGWRIRTVTTALQVTDNWGAPRLCVEEWIEP